MRHFTTQAQVNMPKSRRVYILGTDTNVGKTAAVCALLRGAAQKNMKAVPFKPASSGFADGDPNSDGARLLRAANMPVTAENLQRVNPWRYEPALAPGMAWNAQAFTQPKIQQNHPADPSYLMAAQTALSQLENVYEPRLVLIEGAGGLHVPMPGGEFQGAWISALADQVVIVGRAGLGTINHSLLTMAAVRELGLPMLGFVLCATSPEPDASAETNAQVIAAASGVPHLAMLPFASEPDELVLPLPDELML